MRALFIWVALSAVLLLSALLLRSVSHSGKLLVGAMLAAEGLLIINVCRTKGRNE